MILEPVKVSTAVVCYDKKKWSGGSNAKGFIMADIVIA